MRGREKCTTKMKNNSNGRSRRHHHQQSSIFSYFLMSIPDHDDQIGQQSNCRSPEKRRSRMWEEGRKSHCVFWLLTKIQVYYEQTTATSNHTALSSNYLSWWPPPQHFTNNNSGPHQIVSAEYLVGDGETVGCWWEVRVLGNLPELKFARWGGHY